MEPAPVPRNLKLVCILAVVGIALSGYLLSTKLSNSKSFCDFSAELSCDAVSQSPYSELPAGSGIPISGLGIIAFLIFLVPSVLLLKSEGAILRIPRRTVHMLLLAWAAFSILFYVYLTYLELFVIYAICPLCVITFIITIVMALLLLQNWRQARRAP